MLEPGTWLPAYLTNLPSLHISGQQQHLQIQLNWYTHHLLTVSAWTHKQLRDYSHPPQPTHSKLPTTQPTQPAPSTSISDISHPHVSFHRLIIGFTYTSVPQISLDERSIGCRARSPTECPEPQIEVASAPTPTPDPVPDLTHTHTPNQLALLSTHI